MTCLLRLFCSIVSQYERLTLNSWWQNKAEWQFACTQNSGCHAHIIDRWKTRGTRLCVKSQCMCSDLPAPVMVNTPAWLPCDRIVGLVVRCPPRERKIPGSNPACARIFRSRIIPVTSKLALQWLPCQAPGIIGSALGLVGPVSVYCDWVRWKVWSATSISVWQHVKLSEQIRPWDTLACCWDVKQPTKKPQTNWLPCSQGILAWVWFRSWPSHTSDLTTGVLCKWWPCQMPGIKRSVWGLVGVVSVYWQDEATSLFGNSCVSVTAGQTVWTGLPPKYTLSVAGRWSNQPTCDTHHQGHCTFFIWKCGDSLLCSSLLSGRGGCFILPVTIGVHVW